MYKTNRGRPMAIKDGYVFIQHKQSITGKTQLWRCQKYHTCGGRAFSELDSTELTLTKDHNHETDPASVDIMLRKEKMKNQIKNDDNRTPRELIEETVSGLPEQGMVSVKVSSLRRMIHRQRQEVKRQKKFLQELEEMFSNDSAVVADVSVNPVE